MAGPGRPPGSLDKPFRDALRIAVNAATKEGNVPRLRRIAEKLAKRAEAGDVTAIKEIADRLDGRPHQSVDTDVRGDVVLRWGARD